MKQILISVSARVHQVEMGEGFEAGVQHEEGMTTVKSLITCEFKLQSLTC
jgi:hypothetical protein